jgi:hypothetical protein
MNHRAMGANTPGTVPELALWLTYVGLADGLWP